MTNGKPLPGFESPTFRQYKYSMRTLIAVLVSLMMMGTAFAETPVKSIPLDPGPVFSDQQVDQPDHVVREGKSYRHHRGVRHYRHYRRCFFFFCN